MCYHKGGKRLIQGRMEEGKMDSTMMERLNRVNFGLFLFEMLGFVVFELNTEILLIPEFGIGI